MHWIAAFDFSECAEAALSLAAQTLGQLGGMVTLVYAYEHPDRALGKKLVAYSKAFESLETSDRLLSEVVAERLKERVSVLRKDWPKLKVEIVMGRGDAPETILRVAHERRAEQIVIGTRGHSAVRRFFLGSVTDRVLRMTDLPVVVVPPPRGSAKEDAKDTADAAKAAKAAKTEADAADVPA